MSTFGVYSCMPQTHSKVYSMNILKKTFQVCFKSCHLSLKLHNKVNGCVTYNACVVQHHETFLVPVNLPTVNSVRDLHMHVQNCGPVAEGGGQHSRKC